MLGLVSAHRLFRAILYERRREVVQFLISPLGIAWCYLDWIGCGFESHPLNCLSPKEKRFLESLLWFLLALMQTQRGTNEWTV